ncbi:Fic/DOC family protein [Xanthomonas translucens]|uniref:protein adenylyltransferase n=2 Tax=Xanthomonas TaxID=338 RepID=A0A1C3TKS1_XANCT|nr:Fic family protein [Xanthomonas translucens]KTF41475.1 cell filamentation protein Fic [Xanthomonas translucens pv. translucens]KWV10832.1 cell filamentation protein Fic [Xanthomonas translucens]MCC8448309.1 Fic family protein [Xanthomonas translucens pv. translucens]MCS3358921.1 Fic family protein [Xanthomonas translucens pv. translucens]MCS3373090.1 Fic family protein [Xanthomonas translucens pv. translucens]
MSSKYAVSDDPACYPGTGVLRNKLNIIDPDTLQAAEAAFAATALETIEIDAPPFDLAYLCSLHRQLFDEVYEWAGTLRTVDIAKGTTRFCNSARIEPETNRLLSALDATDLGSLSRPEQIRLIAEFYGELNMVHPFREGNGRTQRLFFEHWLLLNGLAVAWRRIDATQWVQACIAAVRCDHVPLQTVFDACINQINPQEADPEFR